MSRAWVGGALLVFNTAALFILLNIALAGAFRVKDSITAYRMATVSRLFNADGSPVPGPTRTSYQLGWFDFQACQESGERYAADILDDFHALAAKGFVYQPWVEFSEPLFRGKRVSVDLDELGFPVRRTVNPPIRPDREDTVRIFVFGGSTTFGYNVADEDTWPSHLAKTLGEKVARAGARLHVEVTNYGRGYFYPSQEFILFLDLLKTGHRPALAVFMDGVNPGPSQDIPDLSPKVSRAMAAAQAHPSPWHAIGTILQMLPMARAVDAVRSRLVSSGAFPQPAAKVEPPPEWGEDDVAMFARRFAVARGLTRAVGREFGVKVQFYAQPNAHVDYPVELYRRPLPPRMLAVRDDIRRIHGRIRAQDDIIDLGHLFAQWGPRRKAIIDDVHYSPGFNRFLAEEVARHIDVSALRPTASPITSSAATGKPRRTLSMGP